MAEKCLVPAHRMIGLSVLFLTDYDRDVVASHRADVVEDDHSFEENTAAAVPCMSTEQAPIGPLEAGPTSTNGAVEGEFWANLPSPIEAIGPAKSIDGVFLTRSRLLVPELKLPARPCSSSP